MSISIVNLPDPLYFSFFGVLKNDHKNIITHGNLHQSNFPLHFQWDIIVRRSSLVNAFNLPDYGYEPWNSLHDFDEIFDRKFGKPAVSWSFADQVNDHCYTELQHKLEFIREEEEDKKNLKTTSKKIKNCHLVRWKWIKEWRCMKICTK